MHVKSWHSFPDATGVAFALGLGPPSLLAAIFIIETIVNSMKTRYVSKIIDVFQRTCSCILDT